MESTGLPQEVLEALFVVALVGGIFGLIGGFFGSKHRLLGSILLGVIGGISAASIARISGADPIVPVGENFSAIYAAGGGLLLGYSVGRSTA
jgi:FtsH-binding integral membrane protein